MILLCALLMTGTATPGRSLEELERALARTPPVTTSFVEYRFSHLLKKPLRTSGTLEYRADGVMARHGRNPYREATEVEGESVRITRGRPADAHHLAGARAAIARVAGQLSRVARRPADAAGPGFRDDTRRAGHRNWKLTLKPGIRAWPSISRASRCMAR